MESYRTYNWVDEAYNVSLFGAGAIRSLLACFPGTSFVVSFLLGWGVAAYVYVG